MSSPDDDDDNIVKCGVLKRKSSKTNFFRHTWSTVYTVVYQISSSGGGGGAVIRFYTNEHTYLNHDEPVDSFDVDPHFRARKKDKEFGSLSQRFNVLTLQNSVVALKAESGIEAESWLEAINSCFCRSNSQSPASVERLVEVTQSLNAVMVDDSVDDSNVDSSSSNSIQLSSNAEEAPSDELDSPSFHDRVMKKLSGDPKQQRRKLRVSSQYRPLSSRQQRSRRSPLHKSGSSTARKYAASPKSKDDTDDGGKGRAQKVGGGRKRKKKVLPRYNSLPVKLSNELTKKNLQAKGQSRRVVSPSHKASSTHNRSPEKTLLSGRLPSARGGAKKRKGKRRIRRSISLGTSPVVKSAAKSPSKSASSSSSMDESPQPLDIENGVGDNTTAPVGEADPNEGRVEGETSTTVEDNTVDPSQNDEQPKEEEQQQQQQQQQSPPSEGMVPVLKIAEKRGDRESGEDGGASVLNALTPRRVDYIRKIAKWKKENPKVDPRGDDDDDNEESVSYLSEVNASSAATKSKVVSSRHQVKPHRFAHRSTGVAPKNSKESLSQYGKKEEAVPMSKSSPASPKRRISKARKRSQERIFRETDANDARRQLQSACRDKMMSMKTLSVCWNTKMTSFLRYKRNLNRFIYCLPIDEDDRSAPLEATFRVVEGLDKDATTVSLECVDKGGQKHYLRHTGPRKGLKMDSFNGVGQGKSWTKDCSWRITPAVDLAERLGLCDTPEGKEAITEKYNAPDMVAFESVNRGNHFCRHRNTEIILAKVETSMLFLEDATFRIVQPLHRSKR